MDEDSEQGRLNKIYSKEKDKEGWVITAHFALATAGRFLPGEIVRGAYNALTSRQILLTHDAGQQGDFSVLGAKVRKLEEDAVSQSAPELHYAAAVIGESAASLYLQIYWEKHLSIDEEKRMGLLWLAIHYFGLTVRSAQKAVEASPAATAAMAAARKGGRRRIRGRMKNPCWKGYKAYGMKRTRKGKVPNCVPRKTRRRTT